MRNDAFPIVHFVLSNCALVYAATQEHWAERRRGAFYCGECASTRSRMDGVAITSY